MSSSSVESYQNSDCLVVGLNPALQRIIQLNTLELGEVNRGNHVHVTLGGKGQNVLMAASCLKVPKLPTIVQFLGKGMEGDQVLSLIKQLAPNEMDISIRTSVPCRTCITLIDLSINKTTEIIESSGQITVDEIDSLIQNTRHHFITSKAKGIAVMGSMPPGCSTNLYSTLIASSCDIHSKVLLDTVTGIFEAITICQASQIKNIIIKINANELKRLVYLPSSNAFNVEILKNCVAKMKQLIQSNSPIATVLSGDQMFLAITDGPHPSYLASLTSDKAWQIILPPLLDPVVNPIGAGDAVASGLLHYWTKAEPMKDKKSVSIEEYITNHGKLYLDAESDAIRSFGFGLRCGAASCLTAYNSVLDTSNVYSIFDKILVNNI